MEVKKFDLKPYARVINASLLLIHVIYLAAFFYSGIRIMMILNIFSVTTYVLLFIAVEQEKSVLQLTVTYLEIVIHMSLATILLGWECCFQLFLISAILNMYCLKTRLRSLKALPVAVLLTMVYCLLKIVTFQHSPFYILPDSTKLLCGLVNTVFAFFLILGYSEYYFRVIQCHFDVLQKRADVDELSSIYNRHRLNEILEDWHEQAHDNYRNFSVAILDIDDFKKINDTYGHNCGDYVIKKISMILKERCSDDIIVGRCGGEEFLIIQKNINNFYKNCSVLKQLLLEIRSTEFIWEQKKFHVTVTIGAARYETEETLQNMLEKADQKLYNGKANGKNTVCY